MAKSVRVNSGLGGRPKGSGVKHGTVKKSLAQSDSEESEIPDELDDIRENIRTALIKNLPNIQKWLAQIGEDDPKGAMTMFRDFTEFVLPKLQRTDSKIDPSSPVQLVFESVDSYKQRMEEKKSNSTENGVSRND